MSFQEAVDTAQELAELTQRLRVGNAYGAMFGGGSTESQLLVTLRKNTAMLMRSIRHDKQAETQGLLEKIEGQLFVCNSMKLLSQDELARAMELLREIRVALS